MSVIYEITEKFVAKRPINENMGDEYGLIVNTLQAQIALLCSQLWLQEARYVLMEIELDGEKTTYSSFDEKNILSNDIQVAISNINKANIINIKLNYEYEWRSGNDYLNVGPFVLTELLDESQDGIFEFVDYIMHNFADCSDDSGILAIYGIRDGKVVRGSTEYIESNEIPQIGNWYTQQTALFLEEEFEITNDEISKLTEYCNNLMELSDYDTFNLDNQSLTFYLNNACLTSKNDIEKYIANVSKLAITLPRLNNETDTDFFSENEFVDISETGPNMMKIQIFRDGSSTVSTIFSFKQLR
ncbi:MAG: hypothetical protein EOM05_08260 [Clostridia bacterium]|nr:hypothetical protein [Clostridia bacterium]